MCGQDHVGTRLLLCAHTVLLLLLKKIMTIILMLRIKSLYHLVITKEKLYTCVFMLIICQWYPSLCGYTSKSAYPVQSERNIYYVAILFSHWCKVYVIIIFSPKITSRPKANTKTESTSSEFVEEMDSYLVFAHKGLVVKIFCLSTSQIKVKHLALRQQMALFTISINCLWTLAWPQRRGGARLTVDSYFHRPLFDVYSEHICSYTV